MLDIHFSDFLNNEEDLMDSLGEVAIKEQSEMAEEDLDVYRMIFADLLISVSNHFRKGNWCRAAWPEDGKP